MVLVSVIIPTKNEERDLPSLIKSLKNQSFRDFEALFVDGGSIDKTRALIKKAGFKLIIEDPAIGPGNARNIGAKKARGKFLVFVDADNVLSRDYLHNIVSDIQNVDAVSTSTVAYKPNFLARVYYQERVGVMSPIRMAPNAFRKEVFLGLRYPKSLGFGEDQSLLQQFVKKGYKKFYSKCSIVYHKEPDTLSRLTKESLWWGRTFPDYVKQSGKRGFLSLTLLLFKGLSPLVFVPLFIFNQFLSLSLLFAWLFLMIYYVFKSYRARHDVLASLCVPFIKFFRSFLMIIGLTERILLKKGKKLKGE